MCLRAGLTVLTKIAGGYSREEEKDSPTPENQVVGWGGRGTRRGEGNKRHGRGKGFGKGTEDCPPNECVCPGGWKGRSRGLTQEGSCCRDVNKAGY